MRLPTMGSGGYPGAYLEHTRSVWRRASLRTKIHLSYLGLLSLPLLVMAVAAYQTATTTIEQNAQNFSAQLTGEIQHNLDSYTRQATRLTFWPFQSGAMQRVLRAYQGRSARSPGFFDAQIMRTQLADLGYERADIAGIYVVTGNGTLFSWTASGDLVPHPRTVQASWYREALAADPSTVFLPTGRQEMISVATGTVFSLVRALHDAQTGARLGAVRLDLDAGALANVAQQVSLGAQGQLLVLAPSGALVYPLAPTAAMRQLALQIAARPGAAPTGRMQLEVGGRTLLATYSRSSPSGWIVAGVVPRDQLLAGASRLRTLILAIAALCILAGALCARLVGDRLTEPVRQLRRAMGRVEMRGDLDTRIVVGSEDEVGQLAHGFNAMLDEIRRLVDDVLRAQIHEREAELHALQNQINPHFLYNTLESINMLSLTHGDREISRMVTALGRLLRLTLSSTAVLIPLRDELAYVEHYLVVQRMRYGERIEADVDVDAELLDLLIPKLTIQPLVENALYHGLEPRRGPGRLTVRGRRDGDAIVILVEDDGAGMDEATLAAVRLGLAAASREGRSVGLANVQQRLKLYCGPAYGLQVDSTAGAGTRICLRLAAQLQEPPAVAAMAATAP